LNPRPVNRKSNALLLSHHATQQRFVARLLQRSVAEVVIATLIELNAFLF